MSVKSPVHSKKKDTLNVTTAAKKQQDYVVNARRIMHRIPELGWQESKTIDFILNQIEQVTPFIPFDVQIKEYKGGICVDVTIDPDLERILFRADVDGLPIEELTGLPFASVHKGLMHACGHDCHSAMLLGAFRSLATGTVPKKNIRFIWQRAEELFDQKSGGATLVDEGVTDNISKVYGLHLSTPREAGTLLSRPGSMMANAAHIQMEIGCTGGHVMHPELGSNAIDIITDIHMALRNFAMRTVGPAETIAFTPSVSKAGDTENIMPNHAHIGYSIRNFLPPEQLHTFLVRLRHQVESIIQIYPEAKLKKFEYLPGFPALINDDSSYQTTKDLLISHKLKTGDCPLLFSGEDFAYYAQKKPGSFWMLGAKQGPGYDHHTPYFNPDESILWVGVAYWLAIATA
ncbi:MAG: amidohydrolase [Chlamydiales bacterium]|nr:amidohydrolase [Chlamydiales bacterium]